MHRSSVPNRPANSRSPAIRSPSTDRTYATLARDLKQEHLANLRYLDRENSRNTNPKTAPITTEISAIRCI
jgi:hypothetical protein